jgi:mxaK protein
MQLNGRHSELAQSHGATGGFAAMVRQGRGALLWALFACAIAVFLTSAVTLAVDWRANRTIDALRAGTEVPVAPTAAPPLLEARADFLLTRDRIDEAQPFLDQAALRADDAIRARMLYNMANTRLRAAIRQIEQGHFDKAIPLVALAKAEYRTALGLQPDYWDAKHNLDAAMRLVRDLPRAEGEEGTEPEQVPSKLWTDLPGVPKGLP